MATVVAAAVIILSTRPSGSKPVQTRFARATFEPDSEPSDAEPSLEVSVRDDGMVVFTRHGLGRIREGTVVALAITVKGFDVTLKERITAASSHAERMYARLESQDADASASDASSVCVASLRPWTRPSIKTALKTSTKQLLPRQVIQSICRRCLSSTFLPPSGIIFNTLTSMTGVLRPSRSTCARVYTLAAPSSSNGHRSLNVQVWGAYLAFIGMPFTENKTSPDDDGRCPEMSICICPCAYAQTH